MLKNNAEEEGLLEYFNNNFFNMIEEKDISAFYYSKKDFNNYSLTNEKIDVLDKWNVEYVFAFPVWNTFSEVIDSRLIHPDWVNWR
jgi:hypothetical protein